MAEHITEHLKVETEILKLTTLVTFGIGGGTVGLILSALTPLRLFFAGLGVLVTSGALIAIWRQGRTIRATVAALKERDT